MKIWTLVVPVMAVLTACAVEGTDQEGADSQTAAVTATRIPAGWNHRCVVVAPAGVNVRAAESATSTVLFTSQCHDWFYPTSDATSGWVEVNKLPKGAEAGTFVDARYPAGFIKAEYLSCYDAASGIDPGVWINAMPACGQAGIDLQPVDEATAKADAETGVKLQDARFSDAWLRARSDGFSFYGHSTAAGTAVCSYATSTESGVVARAHVGAGGAFWCQVKDKPGAKLIYWFE